MATSVSNLNLCACCSKLFFSYQFHDIDSSTSVPSSLEDLWLEFVDCLLLDLDEYLLIDLTDDVFFSTDTSESLELTATFLSPLLVVLFFSIK